MRLILFTIITWKFIYATNEKNNRDNWVDPNDMRYYDRNSKSMKQPESFNFVPVSTEKNESMHNLMNDLERFEIFVERFINRFLQAADLKNKELKPGTRINTEIPILITSEELSRLIKLSQELTPFQLNDLDELLSKVFNRERGFSFDSLTPYLNPVEELFYNMSWEKITVIIYVLLAGIVLWMFAVGRELKRIITFVCLIFFLAGLAWNWWNMYQEVVVEQYVQMQRLSQIPDVCIPQKVSFISYLFSSSKGDEECEKYHKSFRIDPFSKIPPTIVFSETVSAMFIHPLKTFGSGVGQFLIGINQAASWPLNILFLPFVFLTITGFLLCIVVVSLGIKLNFWTLFGGVAIGGKTYRENDIYQKIKDEMSLKKAIDSENDQSYILIQVGTVKKCLNETMTEKKVVSLSEIGDGDSIFRRRLVHTNIEEKNSNDNTSSGSGSLSRDQSNNMMELFKYIPKFKIQSNRINKFSIHKKKYK